MAPWSIMSTQQSPKRLLTLNEKISLAMGSTRHFNQEELDFATRCKTCTVFSTDKPQTRVLNFNKVRDLFILQLTTRHSQHWMAYPITSTAAISVSKHLRCELCDYKSIFFFFGGGGGTYTNIILKRRHKNTDRSIKKWHHKE